MAARWLRLDVWVPPDLSEVVADLLFDVGSCGLQIHDDASHEVKLSAYFGEERSTASILFDVEKKLDHWVARGPLREKRLCASTVEEEAWGLNWRAYFKPTQVTGRIALCPPWEPLPEEPGRIVVVINPKMAFGTGEHETTRICLRALDQTLREGDTILDVGTGTGILSIAAIKLGARRSVAVDTDPRALENAAENLAINKVQDKVRLIEGSAEGMAGTFDLILCNIQSSVILPLLGRFRESMSPGGRVIFSGILAKERASFTETLKQKGFSVASILEEGEWIGTVAEAI